MIPEEFNKYLSYVRNLGFEDTPDYDYLRDLFTQALKNTGEVEDGEYDWMKLNNGKGWEAVKAHPSHLHHANQVPNSSARELHGVQRNPKTPLTPDRLNADLPKPGASRQAQGISSNRRLDPKYQEQVKRKSMGDLGPPEGSTMAQFQNSQQNLPNRNMAASPMQGNAQPQAVVGTRQQPGEQKESFGKKILKLCCCGKLQPYEFLFRRIPC